MVHMMLDNKASAHMVRNNSLNFNINHGFPKRVLESFGEFK